MSPTGSGIVDAWMQHATPALSTHVMLEPLPRWVRLERFEEAPIGAGWHFQRRHRSS